MSVPPAVAGGSGTSITRPLPQAVLTLRLDAIAMIEIEGSQGKSSKTSDA